MLNWTVKKYLREYRIKINSKGYKVMDYDEISAIKKFLKKLIQIRLFNKL